MSDKSRFKSIVKYLPTFLQGDTCRLIDSLGNQINEIRLRVNRPAVAMLADGFRWIGRERGLTTEDVGDCFEKICDYSVFSHQDELSHGFVTLPGGFRVGICGAACVDQSGKRTLKYISSINIRLPGEFIGCSDEIFERLFLDRIGGTMVAGPPCSGKTTLLKDFALKLSSAPYYKKTVLVDERNELAAMYHGEPCNAVGEFCDVLSGYPKAEGILNAVRTLSPEIIICDELGDRKDVSAVCDVVNAGIVIITSIHACNVTELYSKPSVREFLNSGAFERIAILKGGAARCELEQMIEVNQNVF